MSNSGFSVRFFNQLDFYDDKVVKSSVDKNKIHREYQYYYLIPSDLRRYFVRPYNYQEGQDRACYTMDLINLPTIANLWTSNKITIYEYRQILNQLFAFLAERPSRKIDYPEHVKLTNSLYINKLDSRILSLKQTNIYPELAERILRETSFETIDDIVGQYKSLYRAIVSQKSPTLLEVFSHGDYCFSNIFYDKDNNDFRLIDPRGALTEDELYLDEYYDVAKLSHSICGLYDFFNSGLFEIVETPGQNSVLSFKQSPDPSFMEIFKKYLEYYHYDYSLVRLYETSLFLSMLPLHMDDPVKVFGFVLNAINIMEELANV